MQGRKKVVGLVALLALLGAALYAYQAHETAGGGAALAGVTYADSLRFAIDAVRRIYLEGATLREIASDFLPMLGVAAVAMPLAGWLFRKRS